MKRKIWGWIKQGVRIVLFPPVAVGIIVFGSLFLSMLIIIDKLLEIFGDNNQ